MNDGSRRRLEQVWWGVLAGVLATLLAALLVYSLGVPSRVSAAVQLRR